MLFLSAAGVSSCSAFAPSDIYPSASAGVIDLSTWDFEKHDAVDLKGEWEFIWNGCSDTAGDIPHKGVQQQKTVNVPSGWTVAGKNTPAFPVYGCAVYRLNIILPADHPPLSLRMPAVDSACSVVANGKELFSNFSAAQESARVKPVYYAPATCALPQAQNVELVVQMSNYDYPRPGMRDNIMLGKQSSLEETSLNRLLINTFLIGSMFIMAIYHLGLFYQRRDDRSSLYFALLCLCILMRLMVTGEGIAYQFSWFTWEMGSKCEYLSLLGFTFAFMFMHSFYPDEVPMKVIRPVFVLIGILSGIVLLTPVRIYTHLLIVFDLLAVFFLIFFHYILFLAIKRKREYSVIIAVGILLFTVTVINDMLHGLRLIDSLYITPYSLFIFFFAQSYLLSSKFSRAFISVEVLSRDLEKRVCERTAELQIERNHLEHTNTMMERELTLAKSIQQQMLPQKMPNENISAIYHPLMQVGGDFFDFIKFRDRNKIGIFLSDVSGHGVPAAFITLMLKSALLQAGNKKENPADMLYYINEILYNQTGGYFCTAFYGIYDMSTKTIVFANAGHDYPLVIEKGSVHYLEGTKGAPVGILSNAELNDKGKGYRNVTEQLPLFSKILFYTDGLTETRPLNGDDVFFQDAGMHENLKEHHDRSCSELTAHLFRKLVAFRGSDLFEDDIAIVCLEVN